MKSTKAHITLLNRLNLGRNRVRKQELTLLSEEYQQNSLLAASSSAVIQKASKYHFLSQTQEPEARGGRDVRALLFLWPPNFLNAWRSQTCSLSSTVPSGAASGPGHLRWIQKEECKPQVSSRPSRSPALGRFQQKLLPQPGRDKALLNPIVRWVGAGPGRRGIHRRNLLNVSKTYRQNSTPLGTQGREGSIENTAQGRQQEHLLSDSQKRGGGEEEREVSYH